MSKPASFVLSRLFAQRLSTSVPLRTQPLLRPAFTTRSVLTRVPVRSVHAAPKEYNGLQSAAYHFKQQRHMPYFLEYLMWVVFGSEALHLIWLKMDYKEYREKTAHKTKLLEELIKRIESGERIDDSLREEIRMVLMNNKHNSDMVSSGDDDIDDEYLNHLIASSEKRQLEEQARSAVEKKVQKPIEDSTWMNIKDEEEESPVAGKERKDKKKAFFL